ncbi:hypothetical protein FRC01_014004 [Tulasnella sp. 417]|nr:hypothetical protein FRC01_014004 [Tulasnella sp. 417]
MPNFWDIPELVHIVVLFLSKRDQASLAGVNRRLWPIAVTEIWRSVPDSHCFLRLLPADLCLGSSDTESYPTLLRREIRASDFDRLILYSQFTRNLHYKVNINSSGAPAEILNHNALSAAFPHLESLHVFVSRWATPRAIIISPFLRPTLRKLFFTVEMGQVFSTLQKISQSKTLSLEELELNCLRGVEEIEGPARQVIVSQESLRRIKISSLADVTALAHTAKEHPRLTHLDVGRLWSAPGPPSGGGEHDDAPEQYFRSLISLRVSGSPEATTNFLKIIASNRITEITIELEVPWTEPMGPGPPLALQAFKATLANLEMEVRGDSTWDDLEPLLGLGGLQKFSLTYHTSTVSPQVTDTRLLQMARAWPRLTSLYLSDFSKTPTITLLGLGYIATNCQKLRVLCVAFDGTQPVDPASLPADDSPQEQNAMECVDILHSKYNQGDELMITASFFRRWWPRANIMASDIPSHEAEKWEDASAASRTAFWDIPELVCIVVSFLSERDQASLARVNRRLWPIAVTQLWRSVPDLCYFSLLPEDLCLWGSAVNSYPTSLRRPIRASDFDRLILYSQFTRELYYKVTGSQFGAPAEIWNHDALSEAFPHLESLYVTRWATRRAIIISSFLRPTLHKLSFTAEIEQLSWTLRNISRSETLSLQELELNCPRGVEEFVESARQAILSQRSLRRIRIESWGDVTDLAHTAKELPCLTHFDVGRLWSPAESVSKRWDHEDAPAQYFLSLVSLRVSGTLTGVINFLKTITGNGITEITVELEDYGLESMPLGMLLALHAFKATLINLEMQIRGDCTWDLLEPILGLDGLQKFSLTYTTSTASPPVTDTQLLQMTRAWPRLTSLHLSTFSKTPTITLLGLGYVASNSQRLRVLSVAFDGTVPVDPPPVDDPAQDQNAMESLDVLHSKYNQGDELRITTSFFRRWWPSARIIASDMPRDEAKKWENAGAANRTA